MTIADSTSSGQIFCIEVFYLLLQFTQRRKRKMNTYNTATLRSGLRVIHRRSASNVVYCGFQVAVGTRNESKNEEGIAHFCEHMLFKGTGKRTSWSIINGLDKVGGDLNAFTTKDTTVVHCAVMSQHLQRAVSLMSDIVFNSVFPQEAIKKEVEVICDEIESYNDSPSDIIYDEFERWIFPSHPLGNNILGDEKLLRTFRQSDFLRFHRRFYRPERAVFFIDGDVPFERILKILNGVGLNSETRQDFVDNTDDNKNSTVIDQIPTPDNHTLVLRKDTHQAHVMIGCRSYEVNDKRRLPLYLLNNMIGGPGMNNRLNITLREKKGLVYTIESFMTTYSDTGVWATYFGCDHKDIEKCCSLTKKVLFSFTKKPISSGNLTAAKQQLKGQIGIACDQREQFALDFGKSFLHYGWQRDVDKLMNDIDSITADDIFNTATDLFTDDKLLTLIIE